MPKITSVVFEEGGKNFYFSPCKQFVNKGDKVIVETTRGMEMATVVEPVLDIDADQIVQPLMPVIRLATEKDFRVLKDLEEKKPYIIDTTNNLIKKYKLDMKVVDVEFTVDGQKVIVSFVCEDRVDFRDLVKELAGTLKLRIELRQIGIRDQAKLVGGIGCCGKEVCCRQFLNDFDKVSIKMAKTQGLSLNPTKISGVCGRLMCCLAYENDYYSEVNKMMPKLNARVKTKDGEGVVVYNNLLKQRVSVKYTNDKDTKIIDYPLSEVQFGETKQND